MADMICDKCIHFDAENDCCRRFPKDDGNVIEECFESAEDFVKVVRCKDCKKRNTIHCPVRNTVTNIDKSFADNWFCKDGERK